ncbi:MAG: hypothetical protein ACRD2X_01705 [Vicinamibacteraceae bacterium]
MPWSTSAITTMPFFATSDLMASRTCSNDLPDATLARAVVPYRREGAGGGRALPNLHRPTRAGNLEAEPAGSLVEGRRNATRPGAGVVSAAVVAGRLADHRGHRVSADAALGIELVDIAVAPDQRAPIRFTFFWPTNGRWEGRDYELTIVRYVALQLGARFEF